MNATALYEIVKDWPRAAWPENITWYDHEAFGYADSGVRFDAVRRGLPLMFEASGMRWLIGEGHHMFEWEVGETDNPSNPTTLTIYNDTFLAPSILHGISAAVLASSGAAKNTK